MSELDAYDYDLPAELIAQEPCRQRTDARLLVVRRDQQTLEHAHVRDLPQFLRPGDCLVFNNTKVVPARLVGYRVATRGHWEGLFLAADAATGLWRVIGQTRGKLQPGEQVMVVDSHGQDAFALTLMTRLDGGAWAVRPETPGDTWSLLDRAGRVPLPPYIRHGQVLPQDRERYQTVYASRPGAVAAPTAGLHFDAALLDNLRATGVETAFVTLHVGLGTFRPINVARLDEHSMHSEWGELSAETAQALQATRRRGGRIVVVGTTGVRVLETAAGVGEFQPWAGETSLFIRPPYTFRATDVLFTNFHLPRSTLLVLVRTFGGDQLIRRAYEAAILERYRFFSYGDAMLIV